jgi:hypothetical protein
MAEWTKRRYSKGQVDNAGTVLAFPHDYGEEELEHSYEVIGNWRSCHNFPLNTLQIYLRRKARQLDQHSLIAQRIKRLSSIRHKLERYPGMKLSRMQDIGGCRAVLSSVGHVQELLAAYKRSDIKHKLIRDDDYIKQPKRSGYRGVHLIYRYFSDRNDTYNGLSIEIQMRSSLQHAWATAVETVGTFIHQALKSSQGAEEWLRFFALMGTALALREHTTLVPGTPTDKKSLQTELRSLAQHLDVEGHLVAYGTALQTMEGPHVQDAHYFLLELNPSEKRVKVTGYKSNELAKASADYLTVEKMGSSTDAVLVSVDSIVALRRAYPNYFFDTAKFIQAVRIAIG